MEGRMPTLQLKVTCDRIPMSSYIKTLIQYILQYVNTSKEANCSTQDQLKNQWRGSGAWCGSTS